MVRGESFYVRLASYLRKPASTVAVKINNSLFLLSKPDKSSYRAIDNKTASYLLEGLAMSRANSFLFSADFFGTEEAVILEDQCKAEGVLAYIKILCYLRKAEDHSITNDSKIISKITKVSKKIIEKVLEVSIKNNLFFEKDGRIFSKEILEDVSKLEAKKTKLQENALKRWGSDNNNQKNNSLKSDSVSDAKALQLQCKSQDKDKEKDKVKVKVKDKDNKGGLLRGEIDNLEIPKQWNEVEVKEALKVWTEYHEKDLKLPYKSITPIKALLTSLEKSRPSTELVVFAINYAMAHQWQGVSLYPSVVQAFEGATKKLTPQEETQRVLAEWDAAAFELEHPELYANEGGAQ